ncbi:MAG: P-II family nitrogen regulator [Planctomycetes bacterium]|nr:P-II family nitrogen regulator [Planctomycetota bacterium]
MRQIIAFIRPSKLRDVLRALAQVSHFGVTYSGVRGYGRQKDDESIAHAGDHLGPVFLPKTRLCVTVNDDGAEQVIEAIRKPAATGQIGDGKILVLRAS